MYEYGNTVTIGDFMDPQKMFSGAATCEDVMQCFFNLNAFELAVYMRLVKDGPKRSDDLAKKVKKDPTTVYRALQKLTSARPSGDNCGGQINSTPCLLSLSYSLSKSSTVIAIWEMPISQISQGFDSLGWEW